MRKSFKIGNRTIGANSPCFVIAEAGVNHNGDLKLAFELIEAAAESGADAVKFQTFKARELATEQAPKAAYQMSTTDPKESQFEMLSKLELSLQMHRSLMEHCEKYSILFLSSPFDHQSIELLSSVGLLAYKIPSGEITNTPFLRNVAAQKRPIILSTGMSFLGEVEQALHVLNLAGAEEVALLHCISNYPAKVSEVNLQAMKTLGTAFGIPVGYSDHTDGIDISLAARALGAMILEKHLTLDRKLPGPDHKASLEPDEFKALVEGVRRIELALGDGVKRPQPGERDTADVARKSLVASRDIAAGTELTQDLISIKRPGNGLSPATIDFVLGRKAKEFIAAGTLLSLDVLC